MAWTKVDDGFPSHRKTKRAGKEAIPLWLSGCCYANRHLTDGFLPAEDVPALEWFEPDLPGKLVAAGLWEIAEGGYQIHDFKIYNPSKEEREQRRDHWRTKKRNQRMSPGDTPKTQRGHQGDSPESPASVRVGEGDKPLPPVPFVADLTNQPSLISLPDPPPSEVTSTRARSLRRTSVVRGAESISGAAWAAYAVAYEQRYKVPPVRNATVNGQLVRFVGKLGIEEAPEVAAFYVGHNDAFYVKTGHSVSMLLKDAEKLRTEWATGRRINATVARRTEESEANPFYRISQELEEEADVIDAETE